MATIQSVRALEVLDSRGTPTIQSIIILSDGTTSSSSVPSGASKGTYEAFELRDSDPNRLGGLGVRKAVENVNRIIAPKLVGMDALDQRGVDKMLITLDGRENKSNLGANAILSVSAAVAKAGAVSSRIPLYAHIRNLCDNKNPIKMPTPIYNLIEGGKHAPNSLNFQEFVIIPASVKSFAECIEMGMELYQATRQTLSEKDYGTQVADEAGFGPDLPSNHEALIVLKAAIEKTSYRFALDAFLGLDVAANTLVNKGMYTIKDKPTPIKADEMVEFYNQLFSEFSLIYLEDPFAESDFVPWKKLMTILSDKMLIVGDDLTSTNPFKLQAAILNAAINSMIIKPTQIGTVTETLAVSEMAQFKKLKTIVSHRSGETSDDFIADFAVGIGADFVKFGAPARERIAKYNRLIEINSEIGQPSPQVASLQQMPPPNPDASIAV